jgi:hypothetical protein
MASERAAVLQTKGQRVVGIGAVALGTLFHVADYQKKFLLRQGSVLDLSIKLKRSCDLRDLNGRW